MDVEGAVISIDAAGASGIGLTAETGDVTLTTTDAAKKVILNTGTAAIFSHTSDANDEDFTIEQIGAFDASLILSSAGTGVDAITISTTAGGITAKVVDEKNLVLGNAEGNAYFKVAASNTAATEKVEIKNTVGTAADAFYLDASAGGVAINAGLGLTIDAASALEINSSGGTIIVGNDSVANNI